jgi:predicted nucleic acid-binding protein
MANKYYIDTCIWIDYLQNRSDRYRPLGDWALMFLKKVIGQEDMILYSKLVEKELCKADLLEKFNQIEFIPKRLLEKVWITDENIRNGFLISKKLELPPNDVIHALTAKDNNAVLVTRDKHFLELLKFVSVEKPENLI